MTKMNFHFFFLLAVYWFNSEAFVFALCYRGLRVKAAVHIYFWLHNRTKSLTSFFRQHTVKYQSVSVHSETWRENPFSPLLNWGEMDTEAWIKKSMRCQGMKCAQERKKKKTAAWIEIYYKKHVIVSELYWQHTLWMAYWNKNAWRVNA